MTVDERHSVPRRSGGTLSAWVMLLIGLLVGIALAVAGGVFLLGIGWATPLEAKSVISASPSPSPTADDETRDSGDVSEACVRAAEYNLVVEQTVDELAKGGESQDARVLQEALGRLQQAREKAAGASEECLAQAGVTPQADESAPAEPSPSATS